MKRWGPALFLMVALLATSCGISGSDIGGGNNPKNELAIRELGVTVTDSSAVVRWNTTEPAAGTLCYGLAQDALPLVLSSTPATSHALEIPRLEPDTVYWYQVTAVNPLGRRVQSLPDSFRTALDPDMLDTTAPVISNVRVVGISMNSAQILWDTDDRTKTTIYYGTSIIYGGFTAEPDSAPYCRGHALTLTGLTEATRYHFLINASNRAGLSGQSADQIFTTAERPTIEFLPELIRASEGDTIRFSVSVRSATNLAAISFMLQYDPNAVEILGVEQGDFFIDPDGDSNQEGHLFLPETQDPANGILQYDATWRIRFVNGVETGTDANGGGEVAVLTARVRDLGAGCDLRFVLSDQNGDGTPDTRLLDHHRAALVFNVREGRINPRP